MLSYTSLINDMMEQKVYTASQLSGDEVHPSALGHAITGEILWKYLNNVYADIDSFGEPQEFDMAAVMKESYLDADIIDSSDADIVDGARDFRMMTRDMVNSVLALSEYNRFSKGIFGWVGYRTKWLEYENIERTAGETKWSFWKLLAYSLDGIVNFSNVPLMISSYLGILMTFISFVAIIFIIVRKLIFGDPVSGWPSLVCIITFVGGIQLFCMGIMGQYLSKTYMEVKKRPHYIIQKSNDEETEKNK